MKKIMFLSGKRGGFGAMTPLMQAVDRSDDLELQLVLTDMHFLPKFGNTHHEVGDYFSCYTSLYPPTKNCNMDRLSGRTYAIGHYTQEMASIICSREPDLLVLFGDRGESLAGATAAVQMNIPIAHIQGGDKTGTTDDVMRRMISQAASFHYVSNATAKAQLCNMGINPFRVNVVGDLHLDAMLRHMDRPDYQMVMDDFFTLEAQSRHLILVLMHPNMKEGQRSREFIINIRKATSRTDCAVLYIYPCSDPGHSEIIDEIERTKIGPRSITATTENVYQHDFYSLLYHARIIIGNSSCGIIEAPYTGTWTLNLGHRQDGRLMDDSVVTISSESVPLYNEVDKMLESSPPSCNRLYGEGKATSEILYDFRWWLQDQAA